jgi:hypothetical protein
MLPTDNLALDPVVRIAHDYDTTADELIQAILRHSRRNRCNHLPLELIDMVIDFVSVFPNAAETLKSCCLVQHSWTPRSQTCLFRFLRVGQRFAVKLMEQSGALKVYGGTAPVLHGGLAQRLKLLDAHSMVLAGLAPWPLSKYRNLLDFVQEAAFHGLYLPPTIESWDGIFNLKFTSLRALSLTAFETMRRPQQINNFVNLILSNPQLNDIAIHDQSFPSIPDFLRVLNTILRIPTRTPVHLAFDHLRFDECLLTDCFTQHVAKFRNMFTDHPDMPLQISTVHLGPAWGHDFDWDWLFDSPELVDMSQLRSMQIAGASTFSNWGNVLCSVSVNLVELRLGVRLREYQVLDSKGALTNVDGIPPVSGIDHAGIYEDIKVVQSGVLSLCNLKLLEIYVWQFPGFVQPFMGATTDLAQNLPTLEYLVFGIYIKQTFRTHVFMPQERCEGAGNACSDAPFLNSAVDRTVDKLLLERRFAFKKLLVRMSDVYGITPLDIQKGFSVVHKKGKLEVEIIQESEDTKMGWISGYV